MKNKILLFAVICFISITACAQTLSTCTSLDEAADLISNEQDDDALGFLNDFLEKEPLSAEALYLRSQIKADNGEYADAAADATKALENWKQGDRCKRTTLLCWHASMNRALGEYQAAIDDFDTAYALVAENDVDTIMPYLLYYRAQTYYDMGDLEKSDEDYTKMTERDDVWLVGYIGLARNMLARGEYAQMLLTLDKCEEWDNGYDEIYRYRMQAYNELGATERAIDDAIMYLKISRDYSYDLVEEIFIKNIPYAISRLEEVANSQEPEWKRLIISLYMSNGEWRKTIAELNLHEMEYGAVPTLPALRGLCYEELGVYGKAAEELEKTIILLPPTDSDRLIDLIIRKAECCRKDGKYKEAIEDYTSLIKDFGEDTYFYYMRGWCYELSGNDKAAMADYNKGVELNNDYAYIYLMRGNLFLKQGKKELAKADFQEVLRLDTIPEDGTCRQYALHFLGNDKEAMEWMDKYLEACKEDNGTYYDKACLLARMGRKEEAVKALAEAFEKGFRAFAHIEHDDDMDSIRRRRDFKKLVDEYKEKHRQDTKEL